jgi:hypothetical protein
MIRFASPRFISDCSCPRYKYRLLQKTMRGCFDASDFVPGVKALTPNGFALVDRISSLEFSIHELFVGALFKCRLN